MNYWQEKPDFWQNKLAGNAMYDQQAQELGAHLNALATELGAKTILDVGGYKSRMRQHITPTLTYFNYDLINGVDITKPWEKLGEPRIKYDITFTSLVLICLPPEEVEAVIWEMRGHTEKAIVLYEENFYGTPGFEHGKKINEEYGGKWEYNWLKILKAHDHNIKMRHSTVNKNWSMITQIL